MLLSQDTSIALAVENEITRDIRDLVLESKYEVL